MQAMVVAMEKARELTVASVLSSKEFYPLWEEHKVLE